MTLPGNFYDQKYELALAAGNRHAQAVAFAEWSLFFRLAQIAPPGSYYAEQRRAFWLSECIRLEVAMPR